MTRKCKWCGRNFTGHPNKKFHSKKCKDTYWNWANPRGKFRHLGDPEFQRQQQEYYNEKEVEELIHPFSSEGLGQD